jgi:hypothetical protein
MQAPIDPLQFTMPQVAVPRLARYENGTWKYEILHTFASHMCDWTIGLLQSSRTFKQSPVILFGKRQKKLRV